MIKSTTKVVCDAGPIIHLDELNCLDLLIFSLDAGEIEALAIMQKNPQAIFLTDDAPARLAAIQLGFKTHGTIGILIRSIRRGHRVAEETVRILTEIPSKSTLHIKPSLLKEIITKVKNEFKL